LGLPETMSATIDSGESEWSLLRAACSLSSGRADSSPEIFRQSLRKPLNWASLLQLAEHHGLVPILYQSLSSVSSEVPSPNLSLLNLSLLKESYQTNLHRTLFLARELIRVLDHFEALGIDVLPYKGLALAEALYGDIALRQAGDIDLLIRSRDLSRIKAALKEVGYSPHLLLNEAEERAYLASGYECAFDSALGRNLLEVQWALQPRFYAVDFDMDAVFRRAIAVSVAGRNMKTPSAEDLFLILSLHAAKHGWGRLIWLCDIAQLLKSSALNWNWIGETAQSLGILRILQVTLLLTNRLLGTVVPAAAEKTLSADPAALALADEIAPQVGRATPHNVESLSYFRLMMRLRERRADRIRFLQRLAFTPGPGEWKSVRLPAPLFPLYRLVRLGRLATRLANS
jgi:putative nucleotidyltransferase-like protein